MTNLDQKLCVVIGLGESGLAATRLLLAHGARVVLADKRKESEFDVRPPEFDHPNVKLSLGTPESSIFDEADLVVVSPGVNLALHAPDALGSGVPIVSEVELASRYLRGTIVGITGTNGKSTVTSLIGAICEATGRPTFIGGNLGVALSTAAMPGAVGTDPRSIIVCELSSYQLERVDSFRAHVAILLNVTPDHLDRHGSLDAYAAAKGRIFSQQTSTDHAIVPSNDPYVHSLARIGRAAIHTFGPGDAEVVVTPDSVRDSVSGLTLVSGDLAIRGGHNLLNVGASITAGRLLGASEEQIRAAVLAFRGLEHRAAVVRVLDGVTYVNDSKATNVGATIAAIDGLAGTGDTEQAKIILIAGGRDKGGSYQPLVERMAAHGRAAVLIGEASELIEKAFAGTAIPTELASSMLDAVARARSLAREGDIVLLAPACSSFDMFRSFSHRGDEFVRAVTDLRPAPTPSRGINAIE